MKTDFQSETAIFGGLVSHQLLAAVEEPIEYISTSAFTENKCPESKLNRFIYDVDLHLMLPFELYHTFIDS